MPMLQVLLYVFENCMHSHTGIHLDYEPLKQKLMGLGYEEASVGDALSWLRDYEEDLNTLSCQPPSLVHHRVYGREEYEKIGVEQIDTLLLLERQGILNSRTRELVIARLMALQEVPIVSHHIRCMVLFVLFSDPKGAEALAKMEYFVSKENNEVLVRH